MKFEISGSLKIGDKTQKFSRKVQGKDEAEAREKIYSLFGSEHGTQRRWINMDKVEKSE